MTSALDVVLAYHERTKHRPQRYARALGYLDWASQPDPFRRFAGAPLVELPMPTIEDGPRLADLRAGSRPEPTAIDALSVSHLFRDALGLSAWKEHGATRWALRVNPSSGNLHPTEGYLVSGAIDGLFDSAAVHHYAPERHAFERRRPLSASEWECLRGPLPASTLFVVLTSITWREAWKYGERAFRYCQHDIGHAMAALSYAAAALGWHARHVASVADAELERLVGACIDGDEAELGACLIAIGPEPQPLSTTLAADADWSATCEGVANRLSAKHQPWTAIAEVTRASRRVRAHPALFDREAPPAPLSADDSPTLRALVHQRRSAVEMDGETWLDRDAFFRILRATLPHAAPPCDALTALPRIHLALFVHRVKDLPPGIYLLVREPSRRPALAAALDLGFAWEEVEPGLDLVRLDAGDCQKLAGAISCEQYGIAAEGVFAVAMIADYLDALDTHGAWYYRALFWEAGVVGQALYVEAEAAGIRGTGIGCYFDDSTHEVLGLRDRRFQVLYHFTVGGPVDDPRLRTHAPYAHLTR